MREFFANFFGQLAKRFEKEKQEFVNQSENQLETEETLKFIPESEITFLTPAEETKPEQKPDNKAIAQTEKKPQKKISTSTDIIEFDPRDMIEVMEVPFLALSKNRKKPIVYQSHDGKVKVKITRHTGHYLASIYDWDIILFVAGKMQEIINSGTDIPPRTLIVPRHELLRSIHRRRIKKQKEDLELSLNRLQSTLIETTIRNEDYRYRGGFGFLDSWGYTARKDIKEFHITLSQWLYDGICKKGALLRVNQQYFDLTSGLKKFLYRTARKHAGTNSLWEFSIEKLYEKSGSEQEFKKFKYDLKKVISDNDVPEYLLKWKESGNKVFIQFENKKLIAK